jgi:hypothetical protein
MVIGEKPVAVVQSFANIPPFESPARHQNDHEGGEAESPYWPVLSSLLIGILSFLWLAQSTIPDFASPFAPKAVAASL